MIFFIFSSDSYLLQLSRIVLKILVKGHEMNISVKFVSSSCGHGTKAVIQNHKSINE